MPITITLSFSTRPRHACEIVLQLEEGVTVGHALASVDWPVALGIDHPPSGGHGIWGKRVALSHVLHDQDRLELYRPLTVDPKVARRERFVGQGAKKAAGLFAKRRVGAKAGY